MPVFYGFTCLLLKNTSEFLRNWAFVILQKNITDLEGNLHIILFTWQVHHYLALKDFTQLKKRVFRTMTFITTYCFGKCLLIAQCFYEVKASTTSIAHKAYSEFHPFLTQLHFNRTLHLPPGFNPCNSHCVAHWLEWFTHVSLLPNDAWLLSCAL